MLATTATANDRVVDDVATQLGVGGRRNPGAARRAGPRVVAAVGGKAGNPAQRAAWLAAHIDSLPGSGIVYTLTVAQAHDVARYCASGGTRWPPTPVPPRPPNANNSRPTCWQPGQGAHRHVSARHGFRQTRSRFRRASRRPVLAHRLLPAGRPCGRSTASAEVILLPGREDQDVWRYFASVAFPSEVMVRNVIRDWNPSGRSRPPRWSRWSTLAGPGWRWC